MRARPHVTLLSAALAVVLTATLAPAAHAASAERAPARDRAVVPGEVGRAGMTGFALAEVMGWRRLDTRPAAAKPAPEAPKPAASSSVPRLRWPMLAEVNSTFGMRWGRPHQGIDMRTPWHTSLVAPADGTVTFAGWRSGYGVTLEIQHAGDTMTRYAHLAGTPLQVGAVVAAGDWIANTGNTGQSTGPHLHFEVHVGGVAIDPLLVLPPRKAVANAA